MKKILLVFLLLALCLSLPSASEKELINKLPPQYRKWLTEEVVYIITKVEKEVFLQLGSDQERDTFISAFWKQRNPNPNLPENEFKKEHYRRIAYANNWFGKDSPAPGWRTDQGRIYITLGEPHTIERYESDNDVYPTVVWFYQGMAAKGLPDSFNVVFFKQDGIGDFELYSPVKFGPQALMRNYEGDSTSYEDAYYALLEIQPQLAAVSLSLITGEPVGGTPSLASELLIREKIPETPQRVIKDIYASNFLKFKGQVEIDYADNFIESSSQLNVVLDRTGHYFVHYLIEPRRLSFEEHEGKYYTTLELSGNISDRSGKMLTQISRRVPIELSESQMQKVKDKLFSFQDMMPGHSRQLAHHRLHEEPDHQGIHHHGQGVRHPRRGTAGHVAAAAGQPQGRCLRHRRLQALPLRQHPPAAVAAQRFHRRRRPDGLPAAPRADRRAQAGRHPGIFPGAPRRDGAHPGAQPARLPDPARRDRDPAAEGAVRGLLHHHGHPARQGEKDARWRRAPTSSSRRSPPCPAPGSSPSPRPPATKRSS